MKYKKCPRCQLNYVLADCNLCSVCKDELAGKKSIFDTEVEEFLICPYCNKNVMEIDQIMCKSCYAKRYGNFD